MHVGTHVAGDKDLAFALSKVLIHPFHPFPVLTAKIKLTWQCNLRCRACTVWRRQREAPFPFLDQGRVQSLLRLLRRQGLMKVHFSGGEVMLVPWLSNLLAFCHDLGLQVNITTNGTLLDKEAVRLLARCRVKAVNVSIDSPKQSEHDMMRGGTGAWKAAWKGINLLLEQRRRKGRGPKVGVNTLLTRKNVKRLPQLYEMLKEVGVDRWRLLPVDTEERRLRLTEEQWRELFSLLPGWKDILARMPVWTGSRDWARKAKKGLYAGGFYRNRICYAPWFNLFVDGDGSVFPCCMGRGEIPSFGNLTECAGEELLEAPVRMAVKERFARGRLFSICYKCDDFLEENLLLEGSGGSAGRAF